ncbi:MAG: DEAD/DEAH box helicase [Flavobacteriales bacterium]|nr:DEAD/DEAH box helicase [Flavobacteriales bacterium]
MSFSSLGISTHLIKGLEKEKYLKPYPIQEKTIPAILNKKDVLGIAQTGSGKTASYVLPILMNLEGKTATKNRHVNVLVLVPTRELADQVQGVFRTFGFYLPFRVKSLAVFGGSSINPQMQALQNVNVLVATPGRLIELAKSNALHLDSISTLVLDEADKMLNLGFKDEMDEIFAMLPKKRQNLLFSATLSPDVQNVERLLLNDPEVFKVEPKTTNLELIKQVAYTVTEEQRGPLLRYLIKTHEMKQVLVFASSRYQADLIADKLGKNDVKARSIHSKKSQGYRKETLTNFKAGNLTVLVTTDLLSRGIDIEFLPFVINYELPRSPKDFAHRIGRTGRAENPGTAFTFVIEDAQHHFKIIQKKMKKQVEIVDSNEFDLQGF